LPTAVILCPVQTCWKIHQQEQSPTYPMINLSPYFDNALEYLASYKFIIHECVPFKFHTINMDFLGILLPLRLCIVLSKLFEYYLMYEILRKRNTVYYRIHKLFTRRGRRTLMNLEIKELNRMICRQCEEKNYEKCRNCKVYQLINKIAAL